MPQTYFDTTHEDTQTLTVYTEKANGQLDWCRELFELNPNAIYTAEQVYNLLDFAGKIDKNFTPLTSIRARLSTLCHQKHNKYLLYTEVKTDGKYGRKIGHYQRRIKQVIPFTKDIIQQQLFQ